MLENISQVDWNRIKQASGNASHVPEAVKGLVSDDHSIREAAYWKLDNHIVLQSDLYEAAYYVIPFLLEILRSDVQQGRDYVYDLLFEIANGCAPEEVMCTYSGREIELTDACRMAVSDEFELYLLEVSNKSSSCREKALELLVSVSDGIGDIKTSLSGLLLSESDSEFSGVLRDAITELDD